MCEKKITENPDRVPKTVEGGLNRSCILARPVHRQTPSWLVGLIGQILLRINSTACDERRFVLLVSFCYCSCQASVLLNSIVVRKLLEKAPDITTDMRFIVSYWSRL